ncbi:hypothetical protein PoB_000473200 [Plakobranchus ocellatus]|uniref:Uncharacterized protein n=1 Tax=Plakobranchus ocellatus TaxID=259542 RepID=A0AAV3Y605_9GAST|nr:hypothetical protein PoB_000473200 [Plakobranchus ocellatus]
MPRFCKETAPLQDSRVDGIRSREPRTDNATSHSGMLFLIRYPRRYRVTLSPAVPFATKGRCRMKSEFVKHCITNTSDRKSEALVNLRRSNSLDDKKHLV